MVDMSCIETNGVDIKCSDISARVVWETFCSALLVRLETHDNWLAWFMLEQQDRAVQMQAKYVDIWPLILHSIITI